MCASESSHDLLRWLYHGKRNFERKGGWDGLNHGMFEKKYLSKTRLLFGTNPNQRTKDSHTYKMVPKKRINVEPSTNNHLAQARPSTATSRTRHRAATRRGVWDQRKAIDCELFTSEDVEVTDGREMSTLCLET